MIPDIQKPILSDKLISVLLQDAYLDKLLVLNAGDLGLSPGWENPLEKGKATHSSIMAWRIPWNVKSMGSQRVGHN